MSRERRCDVCDGPLHAGSRSVSKAESIRKTVEVLGSTLYSERFDNRQWFYVSKEKAAELRAEKTAFDRESYRQIYEAMGARTIDQGPGVRKSPIRVRGPLGWFVASDAESDLGGLDPRSRAVQRLDLEQTEKLREAGVGFLASSEKPGRTRADVPDLPPELIPVQSLADYSTARAFGKKASPRAKRLGGDRAYFDSVVLQYVKRRWSLHVLEATDKLLPEKRLPMHGTKNSKGLVSASESAGELTFKLRLPAQVPEVAPSDVYEVNRSVCRGGMPVLEAFDRSGRPVVVFHVAGAGGLDVQLSTASVLTLTSKMAAPSFSLPAGPQTGGGTCSAASLPREEVYDAALHICRVCYATSANYTKAINVWSGGAALGWVIDTLSKPKGSSLLGASLTAAISAYARHGLRGPSKSEDEVFTVVEEPRAGEESEAEIEEALTRRAEVELGLWSRAQRRITVPTRRGLAPTQPTPLNLQAGLDSGVPDTSYLFGRALDGDIVGFFRLHDSGDFSLPHRQEEYVRAWAYVFASFPFVRFWAPTRVWAKKVTLSGSLKKVDRDWIQKAYEYGSFGMLPKKVVKGERTGSRAIPTRFSSRIEGLLSELGIRSGKPEKVQVEEEFDPAEDIAPGTEEGLYFQDMYGSPFTYVPGTSALIGRLVEICNAFPNVSIRPSALYVKTPRNPASIPFVGYTPPHGPTGLPRGAQNTLSAGSGVSVKWGSKKGMGSKKAAVESGLPPEGYVTVLDTRGEKAWQCPVYSETTPRMTPEGTVRYIEAKSCRAAGCRACWILPSKPIAYGFH